MKKVRFGAGKWNGFGGKIDPGETPAESAARELFEESGMATDSAALQKMAQIQFYFGEKPTFECHAFIATAWRGEPEESDEMVPQWFSIDAIPYKNMWPSDTLWLPRILAGERLQGIVHFDDAGKVVVYSDIQSATF